MIHVAAVTQLRYPGEGRDYSDRKRAEGKGTNDLRLRLPGRSSPTPAADSRDEQAREDTQERHKLQRDRLNILNGRLAFRDGDL